MKIKFHYTHTDEFVCPSGKTNVAIAAFTTAHARLKLYSYLEKLGRHVIYFDTDSVVFFSGTDKSCDPKLGNFLGEMIDELDNGDNISIFVSGGPKNYAYKTDVGKQVMKIKDIVGNIDRWVYIQETRNPVTPIEVKPVKRKMVSKSVKKHRWSPYQ